MNDVLPEDRLGVEDALGRYLLAVDLGQFEKVVMQFCPDAVIEYAEGHRYEGAEGIAAFVRKAIAGPEARGRMHMCKSLFAERAGEEILLRSYLVVPEANGAQQEIQIVTMRFVEDSFRKVDGHWRISKRKIHRWPTHQQFDDHRMKAVAS
jgi:hypothetical protein